eukprot:NODE_118_length_18907_cov_0.436251.p9 type:complete len:116 gc:universal NODE_118_length_18907_cov_0.436251:13681-14028(+)
MVKVHELRKENDENLQEQLKSLKRDLLNLRTQHKLQQQSKKFKQLSGLRKDIARVLTILNERRTGTVDPKGLKKKGTKVLGKRVRKLRQEVVFTKTTKQWKTQLNFPLRKFALKA